MRIVITSRGLFAAGFVILVVTNIVVLFGVTLNRYGNPEAQLTLTERELRLPHYIHDENSGLALRLVWRILGKVGGDTKYPVWNSPVWLGAKKLEELGFTIDTYVSPKEDQTSLREPTPKEVFIVLDYNGEPYEEAVRRAERALAKAEESVTANPKDEDLLSDFKMAEITLERERTAQSRLFAIDAGLDPEKLRGKYSDRRRFIITKGLVRPVYYHKKVVGTISALSISHIHVPLDHRQVFDAVLEKGQLIQSTFIRPRYKVELAYGRRLEPWVVSVRKMDDNATEKKKDADG